MIDHAIAYASLGWHVFPVWPAVPGGCSCPRGAACTSPGKHPMTARGFSEATTDPATIRAWWSWRPDASIGIAMARSGLLALDVDEYHGDDEKLRALEGVLGELPATLTQRSGSGRGLHLIYRAPPFPVAGVIGGVVVRARAYVLAAPSTHASGGRYEWLDPRHPVDLPAAWLEALKREARVGDSGVPADEEEWLAQITHDARVAAAREHLAREPGERKGEDRPGTMYNVARSVCRGYAIRDPQVALGLLLEYNARCSPPYGEPEVARRVVGAYDAGDPEWGELLEPDDRRRKRALAEIGLAPRGAADVAAAPVAGATRGEIEAALRAAANAGKRSHDPRRNREAELLSRVVRYEPLVSSLTEDPEQAAATVMLAAARAAPGASAADLQEVLRPSLTMAGVAVEHVERAIEVAATERREARARKDARAEARKKDDAPSSDADLRQRLAPGVDDEGVRSSGSNIALVLRWSEATHDRLQWDELTKAVTVTGGSFAAHAPSDLPVALANWLETDWSISAAPAKVGEQMLLVARTHAKRDPLREYLDGLRWDGVPRVETWLVRYCGAADNEYNRLVGAMWLVSAVARGRSPGAKVDTVLVLEGTQGTKKSSALRVLGGAWFSDTPLVLGDKDSRMIAGMRWIIELAELASLRGRENESLKAFLSSSEDNFRPPYGRVVETFARRCVFAGTTNEAEYLHDATGARRFWCVKIGLCDVEALAADRDQIWAEAAHLHAQGTRWWFEQGEQAALADGVAEQRRGEDAWASAILGWWNNLAPQHRVPKSLTTVAQEALGIDMSDMKRHDRAVAAAMREAGFVRLHHTGGPRFWQGP